MYIPKHYAETDQEKLRQFIRDNGFGILFSHTGEEPMATHLPFVLDEKGGDRGVLLGHVARANPQWKRADNQRVLAVFLGPHAYVSPTWYREPDTVPTWNYTAVHVYGVLRVVEDGPKVEEIIGRITEYYESFEPEPWRPDFTTDYARKMLKGIVPFEIDIEEIQGKWKLNQNHPPYRRQRVADTLKGLPGQNAREIAELIEAGLRGDTEGES